MFGRSGAGIGLLVTLGVFISGLLQVPMGYAADRICRQAMAVLGGVIVTASMGWIYFSASFFDLVAAVSCSGWAAGLLCRRSQHWLWSMENKKEPWGR